MEQRLLERIRREFQSADQDRVIELLPATRDRKEIG